MFPPVTEALDGTLVTGLRHVEEGAGFVPLG